jgi:hypothetical protein
MQSKNSQESPSTDSFASRGDANTGPLTHDLERINSVSFDLKTEFKQWRRANRILGRHLVIAEQLGGRALRSARWERGMIMLRGIHIEIAQQTLNPQTLRKI